MGQFPFNLEDHVPPQEQIQQVIAELRKRGVKVDADSCPRCRKGDFNVDILDINVTSVMSRQNILTSPSSFAWTREPNSSVKVFSVVCVNCGYTMFHNLSVLAVK